MDDLERLSAELACEKIVKQFAVFNDLDELEKLADLFVDDGSFARPLDPENPTVGRAGILAMLEGRPPRLSRHIVTNIVIDVEGPDEARGISYVSFLSTTDVEAPRPVAAEPRLFVGEYRDRFVRTPEGWRLKSRKGSMTIILNS
jgi:hypothetical protein